MHESSRLLLVYIGFCCDKHTAVAVVPAEVWEEDGSFLRYHSECTVVISVRPLQGHALMCVPSCGRCWERCIIVLTTGAHCLSEFFCDFIFLIFFFYHPPQWIMPFTVMLVLIPNVVVAYVVAVSSGLSVAASLLLPW